MRTLVFLSVMVLSLAGEWFAITKSGLLERIMDMPFHAASKSMQALALSGSTFDFLTILGSVLLASLAASMVIYALIYAAYRVAVIASAPIG